MIENIRLLAIFTRVADTGSFKRAARELGLSAPTVTQHVNALEKKLGKPLLYRTTRSLSLTRDGEAIIESCRTMCASAEEALAAVLEASDNAVGTIKMTVPAMINGSFVASRLAAFARKYGNVTLDISYSDTQFNLIAEGFDLAVRVGWLEDSSLRMMKIGQIERQLVCSSRLLEGRPPPVHVNELVEWPWIGFKPRGPSLQIVDPEGHHYEVGSRAKITVDNVDAMCALAVEGLGLAVLPAHVVQNQIAKGELVHLLSGWHFAAPGVFVVWPQNVARKGLVNLLVSYLAGREADASNGRGLHL